MQKIVEFFETSLGDSRDYAKIHLTHIAAAYDHDPHVCSVISNALMCPVPEGQARITWQQIGEIVKIIEGTRV